MSHRRTDPRLEPGLEKTARTIRRITWWGLCANLGLCGLKLVAGRVAQSQALVADAVHSLSDTATDLAVLIGVHFWTAPADADHPYGHGRIELLVSVVIGITLALAGLGLGYETIASLGESAPPPRGSLVLPTALASIVVKELLYRWTARTGRACGSTALVANAWHHRSDALSSVPVALAAGVSLLWPAVAYLDQVAALIVTIFILQAAGGIVWPALQKLVDRGASSPDCEQILHLARSVPDVQNVHGLRTRYVGAGLQVDLHVIVDPELTVREGHDIAHEVEAKLLAAGPNVASVLLHVEPAEGERARRQR